MLQRASFKIAIAFCSSASHSSSTSIHKIRNRGPATITYGVISIRQYVECSKNALHSVLFSHQSQFFTLLTFDDCGHLDASPKANPTMFALFLHQSDFSAEIVPPALSLWASRLSRFWRYSITILWTPGSLSISSLPGRLFGPSPPALSTTISTVGPRWVFSILQDTLTMLLPNQLLPLPVWSPDTFTV